MEETVLKKLKNLKACRPDELHPKDIKSPKTFHQTMQSQRYAKSSAAILLTFISLWQ